MALFATVFRNADTAKVYLAGVCKMHALCGLPKPDKSTYKDVVKGLANTTPLPARAPRPWILAGVLEKAVSWLRARGRPHVANALVVAWGMLLRVPSELMKLTVGQVALTLDGRAIVGPFRRKQHPHGSTVTRACACKPGRQHPLCTRCALHAMCASAGSRSTLLVRVELRELRAALNESLYATGMSRVHQFGTHDLRRGAAQEIAARGGTLAQVLQAGQWRSPAFARYLDRADLCERAVSHVLIRFDESDDEDIIAPPAPRVPGRP